MPATGLGYLLFENDEHEEQLVNADDLGYDPEIDRGILEADAAREAEVAGRVDAACAAGGGANGSRASSTSTPNPPCTAPPCP